VNHQHGCLQFVVSQYCGVADERLQIKIVYMTMLVCTLVSSENNRAEDTRTSGNQGSPHETI
jgi:hypothetical protein